MSYWGAADGGLHFHDTRGSDTCACVLLLFLAHQSAQGIFSFTHIIIFLPKKNSVSGNTYKILAYDKNYKRPSATIIHCPRHGTY